MGDFTTLTTRFNKLFFAKLSKNKQDDVNRLEKKGVKRCVAIGLLSAGRCSYQEALMISSIMGLFQDIEVYSFTEKVMSVCFSGKTHNGRLVRIHPQYRLVKPVRLNNLNRKQQDYWYVDLAIEFYITDKSGDNDVVVGIWGMEYDGYPTHFLETNIKNSYLRDLVIDTEYGISLKHITQDMWKIHSHEVIANLTMFIHRLYAYVDYLPFEDLQSRPINQNIAPALDLVKNKDGTFNAVNWLEKLGVPLDI
ncbi:MAG TPA: hypothetical protein DEV59_01785 [Proteus sp.]|nr:hypothetical protein [Proteus sp. (in: enterobacteria)]